MAINVSTVHAYICENTGSRKGHTSWIIGIHSDEWYNESELERFIQNNDEYDLTHDWTSTAGTGRNIFGVAKSFGHGRPGPIMNISEPIINEWVKEHSDKEIIVLYNVLCEGTYEQEETIMKQIVEWFDGQL